MTVDGVTLGILHHYFRAASEASSYALERTAHTTFIKESQDFTTGLVTPDGAHFAYSTTIGSQAYIGIDYTPFIEACAPWEEGDIGIANCPYLTEGIATHLPDYHLMKPVFAGGKLVAFAWAFIHSSDMGGIVAGSIDPSAYELFQEGLRIPPKKLFRAGVVQDDIKDFLLANVRIPHQNWGDLNAVAAALGTAERRIVRAVERWGLSTVETARDALIDLAEQRARAIIARFPAGRFVFEDYLEDDVVSDMPVRVKLAIERDGADGLHFDFTGTDPQIGAAFNLASAGRHPFLCFGLFGWFRSLDPSMPVNGGLIRPVRFTAPEGSVVNSVFPAPVGIRYAIAQLIYGIVQAVLAEAFPGAVPAAGAGQATILAISVLDPSTGDRRIAVVQPMIGGSGGRESGDGVEACDFSLGGLANTPTESIENEVPILVREYSLIPDSGGPGRARGGTAVRLDFQVFHPDTILTARGMERFRFAPFGIDGGRVGACGDAWLNPGEAGERHLGKITVQRLEARDTFSVRTPGGGGYCDPLERAPGDVLRDVEDGLVTEIGAARDYAVVVEAGAVDAPATEALRAERRALPPPVTIRGHLDLGAARLEHERVFTRPLADAIADRLFTLPPALRYWAKGRLFAAVRAAAAKGERVDPADLEALWRATIGEVAEPGAGGP